MFKKKKNVSPFCDTEGQRSKLSLYTELFWRLYFIIYNFMNTAA